MHAKLHKHKEEFSLVLVLVYYLATISYTSQIKKIGVNMIKATDCIGVWLYKKNNKKNLPNEPSYDLN